MCTAIRDLAEKYPDVDFVYPMHLNPNVRKPIQEVFVGLDKLSLGKGWGEAGNMFFIEPLEYLSFVYLMEKSTLVLTDSGGIQEEAPGLGKPVLVMRDTTERPEALDKACFILAGIDEKSLLQAVDTAVSMNCEGDHGIPVPTYVEENVSTKVVKIIQSYTGVVNKMVWRKS
jgi:UDP-N-acetylglucosamine 2-epimerase (non-hydrolysing)